MMNGWRYVATQPPTVSGSQETAMVWIVLALCALIAVIAFVIEEIRSAPEVDESFEIELRDHYRAKDAEARRAPAEKEEPRGTDAA